ncbi:S41 family peptidase [Idiomarina sp.]|uniref:S41 family peptidase n=1 Tax=Idiomarina sp. TaxID=1874361 RepID=UPI0025C1EE2B|nr:S41 family peptidase [Idiomarina sp.]NQZ03792.1 peptidase S41 [Idiomarina sp.]
MKTVRTLLSLSLCSVLAACGGSSSSGSDNSAGSGDGFATCSTADQNQRFFEYMQDDYFWNDSLPQTIDPEAYDDVYQLLEELRAPEDRYSYILTQDEYDAMFVSAEYAGFGFSQQQISADRVKLRFVYQDSPAWNAGMRRADEIIAIDGVAVSQLLANGAYSGALGPAESGITREITWRNPTGDEQTATITKDEVATNTVMGQTIWQIDGQRVGYFTLDAFINRTGDDLNQVFNELDANNVDRLVIDLRYNGGGLIRYANQLATQTAGTQVQGKTFIEYRFNDNNSAQNETVTFSLVDGVRQLDLDNVIVLTTGASCSSSELVINSLRPHVDVTTIGETSCGKPVGQQPQELCDKVTFAINFETVNSEGQGQYYDGLSPDCQVNDAIVADWGEFADPLTGAARDFIVNGQCPVSTAAMEHVSTRAYKNAPIFTLKDKRATLQ